MVHPLRHLEEAWLCRLQVALVLPMVAATSLSGKAGWPYLLEAMPPWGMTRYGLFLLPRGPSEVALGQVVPQPR